ncbi:MAG: AAA family ATPase [Anaerolineales bacterium]|nr:AAA family ATPase [Anaerolineales bacterium]
MHLKSVSIHRHLFPTEGHYPFNLPLLQQTGRIGFVAPITFFVGENGSGKSTLLRAITQRCGIHIWEDAGSQRFRPNPYENKLPRCITVEWAGAPVPGSFFGSETFHDFTRFLDEWAISDPGQLAYFGGESLVTMSHGESLMAFFEARYRIEGLHMLDEPETALSPRRQLQLLEVLAKMSAAGHAQFLIATHSPILLACPGATIYSFDHVPLQAVEYEQTEHYQLYYHFMTDRSKYLGGTKPQAS